MKKILVFAGLLLSALTLTNCQKAELSFEESASIAKAGKFTISAVPADTKTTSDGMSTLWAAGDGVTVFNAPAGTDTAYVRTKFTADQSGVQSTLSTTTPPTLEEGLNYDWYVLYNWKGNLQNPKGDGIAYAIGSAKVTQEGYNSLAHIKGNTFPLVGWAFNVPSDAQPVAAMSHITSLIEVEVKNASAYPIYVHDVSVSSTKTLYGTYNVDFSTPNLQFLNGTAQGNTCAALVTGSTAIAADGSAKFYLPVNPVTFVAGDQITVNVNGYEKTKTIESETVLEHGHIKSLAFNYDNAEDVSGEYALMGTYNGDTYAALNFHCTPSEYDGSTGANPVLFARKMRVTEGQIYYDADLTLQFSSADDATSLAAGIDDFKFIIAKETSGDYAGLYTVKNPAGQYMTASIISGNSLAFQDEAEAGSYWEINKNGDSYYIYAPLSTNKKVVHFNPNNGSWPRITAFADNDANGPVTLVPWGTPQVDPLPRVKTPEIKVSAGGAEGAMFTPVIENLGASWYIDEMAEFSGCVKDAFVYGFDVYYSVAANTDTEVAPTGTITITLKDSEGLVPDTKFTFPVTQSRKPSKNFVKVTSEQTPDWCGNYLVVYEETETSGFAFDGSKVKTGLDQGPKVPVVIEEGGKIPATDEMLAIYLEVKWNIAGGNNVPAPAGVYSVWNNPTAASRHTIGAQGKTGQFNDNTDERFFESFSYDSENHCTRIYNDNSAHNANVGYWWYNTASEKFMMQNEAGVNADPDNHKFIQLYKLEN